VIGKQRTMELVLTGGRLSGRRAFEWGLANVLADKRRCLEQADILAAEIAERPPAAVRIAKRAIVAADELALGAGLERERELFAEALATDDRVEAVDALLTKRRPEFKGR
jgi:enoyl-CoA hydratase/carnithine racemase